LTCSYDFNPTEGSTHKLLLELVGARKRVLDLGCSSGYLGRQLIVRGCTVLGVEKNPQLATLAREHYEKVVIGDLDQLRLEPAELGQFGVILCADILEHLTNPEDLLRHLRLFLEPDGYLLVSLPNVANWRVRLDIMRGEFNYSESGILDRTHLRFFTYRTGTNLLEGAGYNVVDAWATGIARRLKASNPLAHLLSFQFIYKATPCDENSSDQP
jgi:SAM-dependent methyltransferase